jgi:hypothetical protein
LQDFRGSGQRDQAIMMPWLRLGASSVGTSRDHHPFIEHSLSFVA